MIRPTETTEGDHMDRFARFWRIAALAAAAMLVLAACEDDPTDDDPTDDPIEAPEDDAEDDEGADGDEELLALDASCESDELGVEIDYPDAWHVNDGEQLPACSVFDPEPIDIPVDQDLPTDLAVALRQEATPFDELTDLDADPTVEVVSTDEATVDGSDAWIAELEATGDGLHAQGLTTYRYYVDRDGTTLVAETHDVESVADDEADDLGYEQRRDLLDAMMDSVVLTPAGDADDPDGEQAAPDGVDPLAGDPSVELDEREGEPGTLAVTDVDAATHDSFDRVTLEIEGDGTAGWFVEYGEATAQGSGQEVEVAGEAVLRVAVHMVTLPPELPDGIEPWPQERIDAPGDGVVTEVVDDTIFEGHHTLFIGTTGEHPFVVERLEDPQRVVIDVHHDAG